NPTQYPTMPRPNPDTRPTRKPTGQPAPSCLHTSPQQTSPSTRSTTKTKHTLTIQQDLL
ncbi:hypothetical protein CHS0354_008010, partial [Potamilus streckersoni]